MGILNRIFKKSEAVTLGAPVAGIADGDTPGNLGAWVIWDAAKSPLEVYRVVARAAGKGPCVSPAPFSYTFIPGQDRPFCQPLETPVELRDFLRGAQRARTGTVTFDFLLSNGTVLSKDYSLDEVTARMHGKAGAAPKAALLVPRAVAKDSKDSAAIAPSALKAASDAARKAAEEKRLRQEEERKAREAAAAEAAAKAAEAAKAAAAKAAADAAAKAAAAKASGAPAPAGGPVANIPGGRVALIYGTTTGNTGNVAEMIKKELGSAIDHVKSITDLTPTDLTVPEILILGVPTWHIGEMQDDWAAFLPQMDAVNLDFKGKKVAIFGLGDGKGYPDTYVDAMQELWEKFEKRGATLVGLWPTAGYEYQKSTAIKDGKFLGLVIDIENQDQMSEDRVKGWTNQLRSELSL